MPYNLEIAAEIFERFPDYCAQIIYVDALANDISDDYSIGILREAEEQVRKSFFDLDVSYHPHIKAWRTVFRNCGVNPNRFPSGAESLLRRVLSGGSISAINKAVDLYNAVSLKNVIPIGGEDRDKLESSLTLHHSKGAEVFITSGSEGERRDYPKPGEVIWSDAGGATVRAWNWRQCSRTLITPDTCNAYFVLDRLAPYSVDQFVRVGDELVEHIKCISPSSQIYRQMFM